MWIAAGRPLGGGPRFRFCRSALESQVSKQGILLVANVVRCQQITSGPVARASYEGLTCHPWRQAEGDVRC